MLMVLFVICCLAALGVSIARARLHREAARAVAIFRHVGMIVNANLPLPEALRLASESERGGTRDVLQVTAGLVENGAALGQALAVSYANGPALPLSLIAVSERSGTLAAALRQINHELADRAMENDTAPSSMITYAAMVVGTTTMITIALWVLVLPKMSQIHQDFGVTPTPIAATIQTAFTPGSGGTWSAGALALRVLFILIGLASVPLLAWSSLSLIPRSMDRLHFLSRWRDSLAWLVPPLRGEAVSDGCSRSLSALHLAVFAGWPLPDALDLSAEVDANYHWQQQLRNWARRIRGGEDTVKAATEAGMPDMLVRCVSIGVRDANLSPALELARRYYAALVHRWRMLVISAISPLMTIAVGVVVCSVCLLVMELLRALIDQCCRLIG